MKIEPGMLCVVVNSYFPKNDHLLVTALCLSSQEFLFTGTPEPVWICESLGRPFFEPNGVRGSVGFVVQSHLRPIQDKPGEDETLTWKTLEKQS